MSDLIYRDELKKTIKALCRGEVQQLLRIIDGQPKVDAKIEQHGYWIEKSYFPDGTPAFICSRCGRAEPNKEPYCNCGALMDGKETENAINTRS